MDKQTNSAAAPTPPNEPRELTPEELAKMGYGNLAKWIEKKKTPNKPASQPESPTPTPAPIPTPTPAPTEPLTCKMCEYYLRQCAAYEERLKRRFWWSILFLIIAVWMTAYFTLAIAKWNSNYTVGGLVGAIVIIAVGLLIRLSPADDQW